MFAFGLVAKYIVCAKLLLVLGYFIIRPELSREPSSKQLYPSRISLDPLIEATDEELIDIAATIWAADSKRMTNIEVQYNKEGPYTKENPFFNKINDNAWTNKRTYGALINLFNCYDGVAGTNVSLVPNCQQIEVDFINEIYGTGPIQALYKRLVRGGLPNPEKFKQDLRQYWFRPYYRSEGGMSSGFKHTFVGETYWDRKSSSRLVNGFHNWVRMYKEEEAGHLQVKKRFTDSCCEPSIEAIRFNWKGFHKAGSSLFIRTSPELEIALYTLCFLTLQDKCCPIHFTSNSKLQPRWITTKVWPGAGAKTIGSAFPSCTCDPNDV